LDQERATRVLFMTSVAFFFFKTIRLLQLTQVQKRREVSCSGQRSGKMV